MAGQEKQGKIAEVAEYLRQTGGGEYEHCLEQAARIVDGEPTGSGATYKRISIAGLNSASKAEAALAYAAQGLKIFPLHHVRPDGECSCGGPDCNGNNIGKHPATPHGQHDAITDAEQIRAWWEKWPEANIGLNCKANGIAVIDIDPRNGGNITFAALEIAHGDITSPIVCNTGGGGRHIYFSAPVDCAGLPSKLGDGVDLKHNGYVLLPPSNHKSGQSYQWANEAEYATPRALPSWIAGRNSLSNAESDVVDLEFSEFCEATYALPRWLCDDYHEWIKVGAAIFHQTNGDESGYCLWDQWSRLSHKYRAGVTRKKWRSFGRSYGRPITARSTLKVARDNGWRPWAETPEAWSLGYLPDVSGDIVLWIVVRAIEQAEYGDRNLVRRHCLVVAMEVAVEDLDEELARVAIGSAASKVGICADEFALMFDGALRHQRQELSLTVFLAEDPYSSVCTSAKVKAYIARRRQ